MSLFNHVHGGFAIPWLAVTSGLVVQQIFRRVHTYSFRVHATLLVLPPSIARCLSHHVSRYDADLEPVSSFILTYLATLTLSILLYRLGPLHPLARYRGPVACKLSKLWLASVSFHGYQHRYLKRLHERYGDVVRIGPNDLSIRDPSLIGPLLGVSGVPKGPQFVGRLMSDKIQTMVALQDMEIHLQRRRAWNRSFTPLAVKGYEELIATRAAELVTQLEKQHGEVSLGLWLNYFSFDFMSDMAFGGGSNLLTGDKTSVFWTSLHQAMGISTFTSHVPWLGVYLGHIPHVAAGVETLLTHSRQLAKKRIERGSVKRDLFHYLNHEDLPDRPPPSIEQLVDDGILAMIAGADTTASTLTSVFSCLLGNRDAYDKLEAEVDKFFPPGEDALSTNHHKDMHYLTAVINEALRVFPPVPGGTQRQIPPGAEGVHAGSVYLPPGTIFWVHAYSMHRDPRNFWPAPDSFIPERWLVASGALPASSLPLPPSHADTKPEGREFVHNESAFIPFSHGPLNCVGKNLAMQELHMVVCALMHRFRMRAADGWTLVEYDRAYQDYFVTSRGPVPVKLEVRHAQSVTGGMDRAAGVVNVD